MGEIEVSCWCCATRRQVYVKGRVVGERQAGLLRINDCEHIVQNGTPKIV